MAQVEYTGRTMTFTFGTVVSEGLTKVEITENDGPDAEQLDVTVYGDAVYTFITDPLGAKGDDKATVVATHWASLNSFVDNKITSIALNTPAVTIFDSATTATANLYTHGVAPNPTLELVNRRTEIPFDGYATCTLSFEANALGVWTGPA